ncbi:MAG: hypothetical protein V3S68_02425, partial [Dehalococcoidia bacterium]
MLRQGLLGLILITLLASSGWADEAKKDAKGTDQPTATLVADANGDSVTDGLDLLVWSANNGTTTSEGMAAGDFNLDGKVDGLDYILWAGEFSNGTPDTGPAPDPTPDPLPAPDRLADWDIETQGVPLPTTPEELVSTLAMLPKLQKTHWSWPWDKRLLANTPLAHQVARISGSVGLSISYAKQEQVDQAVAICRATGAKLTLQYSPWMHDYEDAHGKDARFWDDAFTAEVELMTGKAMAMMLMLGSDIDLAKRCELDQEAIRDDLDEDSKPDPAGGRRPE